MYNIHVCTVTYGHTYGHTLRCEGFVEEGESDVATDLSPSAVAVPIVSRGLKKQLLQTTHNER